MTGCPSFSCTNISCSIWFCCGGGGGGSNKEHEREQQKQQQPAVLHNPRPSPPQSQVITVPDHLREPSTSTYVEQPPAPPPPAPPPTAVAETARQDRYEPRPPVPPPPAAPPRRVPPTETYYTQPTTTQQQAARPPPTLQTPTTLPAAPPKVHDPWTQTTQMLPQTHPVWSQTPSSAPMLPPSLPSPPYKVLHDMQRPNMQMIPASHVQSEMVHKPPRPARQPSKTYPQTMPPTVNQNHPEHSHVPSETYYYDEAALPDVVPPQAVLPPGDSQHFLGYYPQGGTSWQ